jgi:hypothetical protein
MLLTKEVEVGWCSTNRKHYEDLGYEYKWHGKFIVPIEHLTENSHIEVDVLCDYCLEEEVETIFSKRWQSYNRTKNDSIIQKDCCRKCWSKKLEETLFVKYEETNASYIPDFVDKIKIGMRMPYEEINNRFLEKGYKLLLTKDEYENDLSISSKTALNYICPNHPNEKTFISIDFLKQGAECKYCAIDKHRGKNHYNWNGGISSLYQYLRYYMIDWKKESAKECGYRCVITGDKFDEIHHLVSFHDIVQNILKETNLEIKQNINEYSSEELELLKNKCIEIHKITEKGVCLTKDIHKLFHKIYGRKNNTPAQFYEFKSEYNNKLAI